MLNLAISSYAFRFFPRLGGRCLVLVARFIPLRLLASQLLESETFASDVLSGFDKAIRVIAFAVIESECLFVKVSEKVKRFDRNVSTTKRPLEKRPKVFNAVVMHLPVNISFCMVDNFMSKVILKVAVRAKRIAVHGRAFLNVFVDFALKRFALGIRNNHSPNLAMTFQQSHNGNLADILVAASVPSCIFCHALRQNIAVHIPRFGPDKSFVNLNVSHEFLEGSSLHRLANSVKQKPRALLGNANAPVNLIRANAVLRVDDQPHCSQPLVQANRTILHDGSQLDAEMLLTGQANPNAASPNKRVAVRLAAWASDTLRPANSNHATKRGIKVGKVNNGLLESFRRGFGFHNESTI